MVTGGHRHLAAGDSGDGAGSCEDGALRRAALGDRRVGEEERAALEKQRRVVEHDRALRDLRDAAGDGDGAALVARRRAAVDRDGDAVDAVVDLEGLSSVLLVARPGDRSALDGDLGAGDGARAAVDGDVAHVTTLVVRLLGGGGAADVLEGAALDVDLGVLGGDDSSLGGDVGLAVGRLLRRRDASRRCGRLLREGVGLGDGGRVRDRAGDGRRLGLEPEVPAGPDRAGGVDVGTDVVRAHGDRRGPDELDARGGLLVASARA